MAESKQTRLNKVLREFNISLDRAVEYLNTQGYEIEARPTTILVPGIAGIGKTTFAGKLIERFMHRRNLFYHRCQDWDGPRSFLEAIADWLTKYR